MQIVGEEQRVVCCNEVVVGVVGTTIKCRVKLTIFLSNSLKVVLVVVVIAECCQRHR